MADEAKPSGKSGSLVSLIAAPVAIALLVGGTSPWWFKEFFKPKPSSSSPAAAASPAAVSNLPAPTIEASNEFFVGRWRVDVDLGTAVRNVVDYYPNGKFTGKQLLVSGNLGRQTPESGTWELDKLSDRTFLLKLHYDDDPSGTASGEWTYKILDRNHIQNIDQNYVAERVE